MDLNPKTVRKILLIIVFGAVVVAAVQNIGDVWGFLGKAIAVVSPIITALCVSFVLNVLLNFLEKKVFKFMDKSKKEFIKKSKRPVCLVLTYLIALGIVSAAILVVIPDIIETISLLADKLPAFVNSFEEWLEGLLSKFNIQNKFMPDSKINWEAVGNRIKAIAEKSSVSIFGSALNFTTSVFSLVFNGILSFAISIYILAGKEKIGNFVVKSINAVFKEKIRNAIYNVATKTNYYFTRFIAGQITEAFILGTLCFIGMKIFGFPNALIISVIIVITALVPVVGSIIGAVIGFLLIVITNPIKAFLFLVFLIVLQQLEGNLIYPKVVGKAVGLPGVIVVSAVLLGGNIGGVFGALIAVPTSAVIYTLFKEFIEKREAANKAEKLIEVMSDEENIQ